MLRLSQVGHTLGMDRYVESLIGATHELCVKFQTVGRICSQRQSITHLVSQTTPTDIVLVATSHVKFVLDDHNAAAIHTCKSVSIYDCYDSLECHRLGPFSVRSTKIGEIRQNLVNRGWRQPKY